MLEKLSYPRVFLYELEKIEGTRVRPKMLKRFSKYPEDLENENGFLDLLSPSFEYYIDIDRGTNRFVIKDTFAQKELYQISKDLMNPAKESIKQLMGRFRWIDNNQIRLVNKEGCEKIIDMS